MEKWRGVDHSLEKEKALETLSELDEKKPKESGLFSKLIVKQIFVLNVIFVICTFWAFMQTGGMEPSTLISSWFKFTTIELVALAGIKVSENVKDAYLNKDSEDDDYLGG